MPLPINISASRGAAILGLSDWQTPVHVWLNIMESRQPGFCAEHNYELPVFEDNAALRWGRSFEYAVTELAEMKQNNKIINREKLSHANLEYITCHQDGQYEQGERDPWEKILHEGKTTSAFYFRDHFGEPGTDQVPMEYQIQCQHQMICTGAEEVILSVLVFPRRVEEWEDVGIIPGCPENTMTGNKILSWAKVLDEMGYFHRYHIRVNTELHALMLIHYRDFWENHVLTGIPPEPKTYDDIKALCPVAAGTIIGDEEIERFAAEYKNITSEIGTSGPLYKRKEQIRVEILKRMRNADKTMDEDSEKKWVLRSRDGKKLFQYDGKVFR